MGRYNMDGQLRPAGPTEVAQQLMEELPWAMHCETLHNLQDREENVIVDVQPTL